MKKEKVGITILILFITITTSINIVSLNKSSRLLGSIEHSEYLKAENVGYKETNVQASINDLLSSANSLSSRITSLENKITTKSATTISFTNTTYYKSAGYGVFYSKRDGIVCLDGTVTVNSAASNWTTIATLPTGYRPQIHTFITAFPWMSSWETITNLDIYVQPSGALQFRRGESGIIYYFHICY